MILNSQNKYSRFRNIQNKHNIYKLQNKQAAPPPPPKPKQRPNKTKTKQNKTKQTKAKTITETKTTATNNQPKKL